MTEPTEGPEEPVAISMTPDEEAAHRAHDERVRRARNGERWTSIAFGVSALSAIALAIVYWAGGQSQLEGVFLFLSLGGIGVGMIVWAKQFMPRDVVIEQRHSVSSTEEEIADFRTEFERGENILERRGLLLKMGGAALAALGAALLFPLRSLGPKPGNSLKHTVFDNATPQKPMRLVDEENKPIKAEDINLNGVITAYPPDDTQTANAPTLLIRPSRKVQPRSGREGWTPRNIVAYSKLCTHVGCPVGLYQAGEHLLLCPCHQSTFDVLDGANPIFGPATRSLPQLPIAIDDDGYVVATGDFSSPTGGGFWNRDR